MAQVHFRLSQGIKETIKVPLGTCNNVKEHIETVTTEAGLSVEKFEDNPPHWNQYTPAATISDYDASRVTFEHNRFIRCLYDDLAKWSESEAPENTEDFTPEFAEEIWYGLSFLTLPFDRWDGEAYQYEMQRLLEAMQGTDTEGVSFDAPPLTDKQAAAVIFMFSHYFDRDDVRLELPNDRYFLVPSNDYYRCPNHGAWLYEDIVITEDETGEEDDILMCPSPGCKEVFC